MQYVFCTGPKAYLFVVEISTGMGLCGLNHLKPPITIGQMVISLGAHCRVVQVMVFTLSSAWSYVRQLKALRNHQSHEIPT